MRMHISAGSAATRRTSRLPGSGAGAGVARALIAASLRELGARGMDEAALSVHTENPNGAFQLYESMGYRVVRMFTDLKKPMEPDPAAS